MAGEVVRITNGMSQPFVGKHDGQPYRIAPGGSAIVPVEAMWHWCGRPHLVDRPPTRLDRKGEVSRLKVLYGAAFPDPPELGGATEEEKWERNKPLLEVYDLSGERIVTVLDDPEGRHLTPATETELEKQVLKDTIESMKAQLAQLTSQYAAEQRGELTSLEEVPSDGPPVPKDDPTKVPVGVTTGAKRGRNLD